MLTRNRISEIEASAAHRRKSTAGSPRSYRRINTKFFVDVHASEQPEDGNRKTFGLLMKFLKGRGWKIGVDPNIHKNYRILSPEHRAGSKGVLRLKARYYRTGIELEFFPDYGSDNPNGQEYGSRPYERATYLDRKRLDLIMRQLAEYFERREFRDGTEPEYADPREEIEYRIRSCWHFKEHDVETQNRPDLSEYNRKDMQGNLLSNGDVRYFRGWNGELLRGVAYHNINNMWWVLACGQVTNVASHSLFSYDPILCRKRHKCREIVSRMRRKLERAVAARDYRLAEMLGQQIWRLDGGIDGEDGYVLMKRGLYYRGGYNGYTNSLANAGLYTKEAAERHAGSCSGEVTFARLKDLTSSA